MPSLLPYAGKFLRVLPPLLYGLTVMNLWVKVQLPHASLLHWTATAAFTLSLQVGMPAQLPLLRSLLASCVLPDEGVWLLHV